MTQQHRVRLQGPARQLVDLQFGAGTNQAPRDEKMGREQLSR
jgi:hypothetical protein